MIRGLCVRSTFLLVLICCTAIAVPHESHGATPDDVLPAPISSADVARYAELLAVSRAQKQAMRRAHAEYLARYAKLRAQSAPQLTEHHSRLGSDPISQPNQDASERFFPLYRRAYEQIRTLDHACFDDIKPLLSDEQLVWLERLRGMRQRSMLLNDPFIERWLTQWRFVEPIALIEEADLDPESRSEIERIAREMELTALSHLERLARRTWRLYETWPRLLTRHDLGAEHAENLDANERGALFSERAMLWMEEVDESRRAFHTVRDHWRAGVDRMVDAIPEQRSDERWRLFEAAVRSADGVGPLSIAHDLAERIEHAQKLSELPTQTREAIELLNDDARLELRIHIRRSLYLSDRLRPRNAPHIWDREQPEIAEQLKATRQDGEKMLERFIHRLDDALGEDHAPRLAAALKDSERELTVEERAVRDRAERVRTEIAPEPLVPGPIDRRAISIASEIAELDNTAQAVLETLYADYLNAFNRIRRDEVESLLQIFVGFRFDPEQDSTARYSPPETVEKRQQARQRALRAIRELNDRFLADVELVLDNEQHADAARVLRLAKAAALMSRGIDLQRYRVLEYNAHRVNLLNVLADADLPSADRRVAVAILLEHAPKVLERSRTQHRAELMLDHASAMSMALMRGSQEQREQAHHERQQRTARLKSERSATIALHHEVLRQWQQAVSPAAYESLRETYERAAYPRAFEQNMSVYNKLHRAIELDDLATEQRSTLHEALQQYEADLRVIQSDKVSILADDDHYGLPLGDDHHNESKRREAKLAGFASHLEEINQRARLILTESLTDAQFEVVAARPSAAR